MSGISAIPSPQTAAQLIARLTAAGFNTDQTDAVVYLANLVFALASALDEQGVELPEVFTNLLDDFDPDAASEPQGIVQ